MTGRRLATTLVSALLAGLMIFGNSAQAVERRVVREAVVSKLAGDGRVESASVVQLLHLDSRGAGEVELRIPNVEDLESYRNLSGFRGPSGEGDDLVWRTDGRLDARALASYRGRLPVDVRIRYFLDGREMEPGEIKRRSGDVRIEVELANVSGEPKTLQYKAVTSPYLTSVVNQYIPIEYVVRVEFPISRWRSVGGENVRVIPDGDKEIASVSGILSPPLTSTSRVLTFEASSDDVLTPRIQVYAIPGLSQDALDALEAQFEALRALYGGAGAIGDNLSSIYDGTLALVDGVEEMLGGVGTIDQRTRRPVIQVGPDGLPTTLLGTLGFLSGALRNDVLPGIGERDPETGKGKIVTDEKGVTTTLLGSLQSQKDAYDERLIPGMVEVIAGLDQISSGLSTGGGTLISGLDAVIVGVDTISAGLSSGGAALKSGLQQVDAGLTALLGSLQTDDMLNPGFREGLLSVQGGLTQLLGSLQTDDMLNPGFREGLLSVQGGLTQLLGSLQTDDMLNPGFREGLLGLQQAALIGQSLPGLDPIAGVIFGDIAAGLGALVASLGDVSDPPSPTTIIGVLQLMAAGVGDLLAGLGDSSDPPSPATIIGAVQLLTGGLGQLIAGLGNASDPPTDATIIGALQLLSAGLSTQAIPGVDALVGGVLGGLTSLKGGLATQVLPGTGQLVDGVLAGLAQVRGGLTNPGFTQPQPALGGRIPKDYYKECPGCFDPDHPAFDPATADPAFQPRFLEVFTLFSEGVEAALPRLQSFDDADPGLIDGLQQIAGGLETLASKLQTFDPDDPGLVDALQLVRGGLQQVNQGLFAVNELGLRTMRGQIGDEGDSVGRSRAALTHSGRATESVLGSDADFVSAAYVFDLPAQSTAANDNARRGALMALALAGMALLATRVRRFEL